MLKQIVYLTGMLCSEPQFISLSLVYSFAIGADIRFRTFVSFSKYNSMIEYVYTIIVYDFFI